MKHSFKKIKRKLWSRIVAYSRSMSFYPYLYQSYWHSLLYRENTLTITNDFYFTAQPNPGAGIGHQIANWIAGYWWAKYFELKFAHSPFSKYEWERFLGFGKDEVWVEELIRKGYQKVFLPLFDENLTYEVKRIQSIINSYKGKKVIFVCELDQYYKDQYGVRLDIQRKFYSAPARKDNKLIFSKEYYNIAIHVRRGDIVVGQVNKNPNLNMRWQDNDYFINVLNNVLRKIVTEYPIAIYLFSQGIEKQFEDFKKFPNIHFCLGMNVQDTFLHMVYADLLITSKSSFSYKPALLNQNIKVSPKDFWHSYPSEESWVLADEEGNIEL